MRSARRGVPALKRASQLLDAALDLVYPRYCVTCADHLSDEDGAWLCARCLSRLPEIGSDQCPRCGEALGPFSAGIQACPSCRKITALSFRGATAVCRYKSTARDMIHRFKYSGDLRVVSWMGRKITEKLRQTDWFAMVDAVVPVPLHWTRRLARRFNQSELLARVIVRESGKQLMTHVVLRKKRTPPQALLSPTQREENVRGAFSVIRPERIRGKRLLLVDDVMTTCATARECARAFVKAGAREVYAAVFAR